LNAESYRDIVALCQVVIHTAADYGQYDTVETKALDVFLAASTTPKRLIFTSGILVYADSPAKVLSEADPPEPTAPIFRQRIANEERVLKSKTVHGSVLRPAYVFGKKTSHFVDYFEQALRGSVVIHNLKPDNIWSQVHIDDLCEAYVRLAEAPVASVSGHTFNVADDSRFTHMAIAKAFAVTAGYSGPITVTETKDGHNWGNKTVIVSNAKCRTVLGWNPRKALLLDEAALHFRVWKAIRDDTAATATATAASHTPPTATTTAATPAKTAATTTTT